MDSAFCNHSSSASQPDSRLASQQVSQPVRCILEPNPLWLRLGGLRKKASCAAGPAAGRRLPGSSGPIQSDERDEIAQRPPLEPNWIQNQRLPFFPLTSRPAGNHLHSAPDPASQPAQRVRPGPNKQRQITAASCCLRWQNNGRQGADSQPPVGSN